MSSGVCNVVKRVHLCVAEQAENMCDSMTRKKHMS